MYKCCKCEKEISHDEVALTKKLLSKRIEDFLCFECLSKYFDTSVDKLKEQVERFKEHGCTLF